MLPLYQPDHWYCHSLSVEEYCCRNKKNIPGCRRQKNILMSYCKNKGEKQARKKETNKIFEIFKIYMPYRSVTRPVDLRRENRRL
jgi:hypothetical protein